MDAPEHRQNPQPEPATHPLKSRGGVTRLFKAWGYSLRGLRAALKHEAAFRQEVALGLPLLVLGLVYAPGRWQALALVVSILQVWLVELLNSAVEALADAQSIEFNPLLGRAKDLGSAAVMVSLGIAVATWLAVFLPAFSRGA